jgi:exodeoxyribonuclease VII large subunit
MQAPVDSPVYSVSQLNRDAREVLESGLPPVWVEGEISNLAQPGSGHLYFTLKDAQAQVRCAMFRRANRTLGFSPDNGLQVLVNARVTIYEPRGSFQLIVEHMEPAGEGLLRRKFEELKQRLATEGLFAADRKQELPQLPRQIGVITSPTGAAIRDILQITRRRFAGIPVVIYPVQVQGDRAKNDIVRALATAAERAECDVLILARGGGSLEDLWAFNEEIVARAIDACPIPVVSAVGHEVDFTIADLVADLRAPTPSGAAELVVPDAATLRVQLAGLEHRAAHATQRSVQRARVTLDNLAGRLARCHPGTVLRQHAQRLDEIVQRLTSGIGRRLGLTRVHWANSTARLRAAAPLIRVEQNQQRLHDLRLRLESAARLAPARNHERLAVIAAKLHGTSPLGTLARGYAIVQDERNHVVRDAEQLQPEQAVTVQVARGQFVARVKKILAD